MLYNPKIPTKKKSVPISLQFVFVIIVNVSILDIIIVDRVLMLRNIVNDSFDVYRKCFHRCLVMYVYV